MITVFFNLNCNYGLGRVAIFYWSGRVTVTNGQLCSTKLSKSFIAEHCIAIHSETYFCIIFVRKSAVYSVAKSISNLFGNL